MKAHTEFAVALAVILDTTIRPLPLLETLAASTHTTSILEQLREASLESNDIAVLGRLVSFLATTARISCLECLAAESPVAAKLARPGGAAWVNPDLLDAIAPLGGSHRTTKQMHGKVRHAYLAEMAFPRRGTQTARPDDVFFTERLGLLAVVWALEPTIAGVPCELHLEAVYRLASRNGI